MKQFSSPVTFRQALEERLKQLALERGVSLQGLRVKVAIERLLARLFSIPDPPWLLKGGYAMELRYRPQARPTKDIDLTLLSHSSLDPSELVYEEIREALQQAISAPLNDFFSFEIGRAKIEIQGAPYGGASFPVEAQLADREFVRLSIDVGIGDPVLDDPEILHGEALLEFAGFSAATVLAIPKEQQFAEKLHCYSFPWEGRVNSRTKDFIDLIILIDRGSLRADRLVLAVEETFRRRGSHPVPTGLLPPPVEWSGEFDRMCKEVGINGDLQTSYSSLVKFWEQLNR